MKRIKIILCSLLCVSLVGCSKSTVPTLAKESLTLEYGENPFEEAKLEDLLENYDDIKKEYQFSMSLFSEKDEEITADSISDDDILSVGKYNLIIQYTDDKEPLQLPITIKDTKAPEFKDFKEKVSVDYGYSKDPTALFSATDLADVKISIDGDVNVKKAGNYKVKVTAEDANGNKTEKDCTITVKAKPKKESTSTANSSASSNTGSTSSNVASSSKPATNSTNKKPATNGGQSSSNSSSNTGASSNSGTSKPACTIPDNQYDNSGMKFATKEEAHAWAKSYIKDNEENGPDNIVSYSVSPVVDTCDNIVGYTVGFNYEGQTPDWNF